MADFKKGDHVSWNTSQGKTSGKVTKKVTGKETIKGYTAKATKEDPEFEVASDATGAKAVHKPESLKKE